MIAYLLTRRKIPGAAALDALAMLPLALPGLVLAFGVITFLHIVLGEQAPKNWAILYADWMLEAVALPLVIFTYICYPAIWLLNALTNGAARREKSLSIRVFSHQAPQQAGGALVLGVKYCGGPAGQKDHL